MSTLLPGLSERGTRIGKRQAEAAAPPAPEAQTHADPLTGAYPARRGGGEHEGLAHAAADPHPHGHVGGA